MLGIQSGIEGLRSANIINQSTRSITKSIGRIASNSRINHASDDPTGLGVSEKLRNRVAGLDQASQNVQNSTAFFNVADGALSNTANILNRLKELAVKSTDTMLSTAESALISTEVSALTDQIDSLGKVKYGDVDVFSSTTLSFFIGADAGNSISIGFGQLTSDSLGLAGLVGALASSSAATLVNKALGKLTNMQAKVGTYQSTFGYIQDALDTEATNLREADATLRDVDTAKEMTNFVKETIRMQAAQFMTAQGNQSAYSVLNLLQ